MVNNMVLDIVQNQIIAQVQVDYIYFPPLKQNKAFKYEEGGIISSIFEKNFAIH